MTSEPLRISRSHARLELVHVSPVRLHDHLCAVYSDADEQKNCFVPYLQEGLLQGDLCLYVFDETSKEFVLEALSQNGFNVRAYVESGALKIVHSSEAHMKGGSFDENQMMQLWEDLFSEASSKGFSGIRAAGEMTWSLGDKPGAGGLIPYESRLTEFSDKHPVALMCMYNRSRFSAEKLKATIHAHPKIMVRNQLMRNPGAPQPGKLQENNPVHDVDAFLITLKELNDALSRESAARERAERLLVEREQSEQVKQLNEDLQALARTVSHELQEPVGKIRSYLKLLSVRYKGRLGEDADEFIDICSDSAKTVHRMIDDLWVYARATQTGQLEAGRVSVEQLVDEVVRHQSRTIQAKGAQVIVYAMPDVKCHAAQLKYVFTCLLGNALTYTIEGRVPRIEIGCTRKSNQWLFSVSDNGQGIDPMHFRDIFRMFYRINNRPGDAGTGMGLATSKKIVEAHNGRMFVESKPGQGSTFYFTIKDS
jgi:signal transduction histidine kinase